MDIERLQNSSVGRLVPIRGTDPRFGNEPYEHFAFVPNPLPAALDLQPETWQSVTAASVSLGRLDQAGRQLPDARLLRLPTLRREAQSTSALEGTFAPFTDVLGADVNDLSRSGRSAELLEVMNYVRAAEFAYDAIKDRGISTALLFDVHKILVANTKADGGQAGRVRDHQVVIGSHGQRISSARFIPPPSGHDLEIGLRQWSDWLGAPIAIPAVAKAAMAHYQFETLHPFNDGNGRIGRLVIVLQLLREGILHVSPWFEARRLAYRDQLQRLSETGDWDAWISFFCAGIEAQAEATAQKVTRLMAYQQDAHDRARSAGLRGTALDLVDRIVTVPVFTVAQVARAHHVSRQTATQAVNRLVEMGIVREGTGGNYDRVFVAESVVEILEA
jgi:Fic family protein